MSTLRELQEQLITPFPLAAHEIKPGPANQQRAMVLAFVDPREYEQRLDDIVGPENWLVEYRPLSETAIFCRLTIMGVFKEQVGEEHNPLEPHRACHATAQAFKRACSAFGLGRYLYSLPQTWANFDGKRFSEPTENLVREMLHLAGLLPVMRLERILRRAKTVQSLNAASSMIVAATERGDLFEEERNLLRKLYKEKCEALLPKKQAASAMQTIERPNPYTKQSPPNEKQLPKEPELSREVRALITLIEKAESFSDLESAQQQYDEMPLSADAEVALRKAFEAKEAELNQLAESSHE